MRCSAGGVRFTPELTFECAALWIVLVHGFWFKDLTAINTMIGATGLLVSYWEFRFGVLGVYVSGRTCEKMSLATGQDTPGVLDRVINKVVKKKQCAAARPFIHRSRPRRSC